MTRSSLALVTLLLGCPKAPDDTVLDTNDSAPTVAQCPVDSLVEGDFRIDAEGSLTQIHPSAAWDGEAVWVAYVLPESASSNFDIWATRIGVDGETLVAPFQVDGGEGYSETYPRVAVADGRVVVAWQADNGSGVDNMDLALRSFAVDGGAMDESPVVVEPSINGTSQTGNGWMPALVGRADSRGFWLAGAWALDGYPSFQTVVMGLEHSGQPGDYPSVPEGDPDTSQYYPSIALGPDWEIGVAWESWGSSGATTIGFAQYEGGMAALNDFADHDDAGLPFVAWELAADGQPILAYYSVNGGEYDIELAGGDLVNSPVLTTLGQPGKLDHTPIVAAAERGAVVAWMRNLSGLSNELVLQPVRLEGESWTVGDEQVLDTETAVAPYLPGLTWLCEDAWFVTWIEGDNPDYLVKGRFLRFEGFGE